MTHGFDTTNARARTVSRRSVVFSEMPIFLRDIVRRCGWPRAVNGSELRSQPDQAPTVIEVMADERWERLAEQQGVAYAQTVAGAMNLKLDADNPADR